MYVEVPSRADIQQQLIMEESKDISTQGQTNWIACGIKIQELQSVHKDFQCLWH
jgi:recombinational DNA repair ATPase RecF